MTPAQLAVWRLYCDEVARAWTVILSATMQLPIALQQQAKMPQIRGTAIDKPVDFSAPCRKSAVPVSDYLPQL